MLLLLKVFTTARGSSKQQINVLLIYKQYDEDDAYTQNKKNVIKFKQSI